MAQGSRGGRGSWIAVALIILGFAIGGLGLTLGPQWVMVIVGVVVTAVGGAIGLAAGIMEDWH